MTQHRVGDGAPSPRVHPAAVEAIQPVAKPDLLRRRETQRRVVELDPGDSGRQARAARRGQRPPIHRDVLDLHGAPLGVLVEREDGLQERMCLRIEVRQPIAVEATQAAAPGADPQRAVSAFAEREDAVVDQTVFSVIDAKSTAAQLMEPAPLRPHPHEPIAVFQDARDVVDGEPILLAVGANSGVGHAAEPVRCSDPEASGAALVEREDIVVRKAVLRRIGPDDPSLVELRQASGRADPDVTPSIHEHRPHELFREAVLFRQRAELALPEAVEPVVRTDPEAALAVLAECPYPLVGEALGGSKGGEDAVPHPARSSRGRADPDVAFAVPVKGRHVSRGGAPGVLLDQRVVALPQREEAEVRRAPRTFPRRPRRGP